MRADAYETQRTQQGENRASGRSCEEQQLPGFSLTCLFSVLCVVQMMTDLRHHVREEEEILLPSLQAVADQQQLIEMGRAFQAAKVTTRPHPEVRQRHREQATSIGDDTGRGCRHQCSSEHCGTLTPVHCACALCLLCIQAPRSGMGAVAANMASMPLDSMRDRMRFDATEKANAAMPI